MSSGSRSARKASSSAAFCRKTLPNGALPHVTSRVVISDPAPNGLATVVNMQAVGETRYFDAGGFPGRTVGLTTTALPEQRR